LERIEGRNKMRKKTRTTLGRREIRVIAEETP
jgi:hypothetical protein